MLHRQFLFDCLIFKLTIIPKCLLSAIFSKKQAVIFLKNLQILQKISEK